MKKHFLRHLLALAVILCGLGFIVYFGYRSCQTAYYPEKYQSLVTEYARKNALDPALVYAVIRCESDFNPNAVSKIGARGLMQLTPETYWWVQQKLKISPQLSDDKLYEPETNLRCGTYLLAELLSEYANEQTALAAYHAGRATVRKWLANTAYSKDRVTLSYIPYADTRTYVRRVAATKAIYRKLYHL